MVGTFTVENVAGNTVMMTGPRPRAVLVFPSWDAAQALADSYVAEKLHVVELQPETIRPWIDKVRGNGAKDALLNPSPAGSLDRVGRVRLDAISRSAMGNNAK